MDCFGTYFAWVWRYHLPKNANFKVELAKICWPSSLPAVPKKEAANSTCRNTIAVKSTKHKLNLKTHGLLPTRDLVCVAKGAGGSKQPGCTQLMLTRCWRSKKSLACQMTWQKHGSQVCTWAWGGTQCMDILKTFRRRMHASRSCGRVSSRRVCPSSWSSSQRNCKQPGHSCVVTSQPLRIFRFWPNWGTSPRVWQIMCLQIVWLPILRSSIIWTRCTKSHRSKPGTKCEPRATERGPKVQAGILRLDFLQDPRVTDWLQNKGVQTSCDIETGRVMSNISASKALPWKCQGSSFKTRLGGLGSLIGVHKPMGRREICLKKHPTFQSQV